MHSHWINKFPCSIPHLPTDTTIVQNDNDTISSNTRNIYILNNNSLPSLQQHHRHSRLVHSIPLQYPPIQPPPHDLDKTLLPLDALSLRLGLQTQPRAHSSNSPHARGMGTGIEMEWEKGGWEVCSRAMGSGEGNEV